MRQLALDVVSGFNRQVGTGLSAVKTLRYAEQLPDERDALRPSNQPVVEGIRLHAMGILAESSGALEDAIKCFKRSSDAMIVSSPSLLRLVDLYRLSGKDDESFEALSFATHISPNTYHKWRMAAAQLQRKDPELVAAQISRSYEASFDLAYPTGFSREFYGYNLIGVYRQFLIYSSFDHREYCAIPKDFPEQSLADAGALGATWRYVLGLLYLKLFAAPVYRAWSKDFSSEAAAQTRWDRRLKRLLRRFLLVDMARQIGRNDRQCWRRLAIPSVRAARRFAEWRIWRVFIALHCRLVDRGRFLGTDPIRRYGKSAVAPLVVAESVQEVHTAVDMIIDDWICS